MPSTRHLRFPTQAAFAVCAVAAMIWANRNEVTPTTSSARHAVARPVTLAGKRGNVAAAAAAQPALHSQAFAPTQVAPTKVTASVSQILPELAQEISDWRAYRPQKLTIAPHADLAMDFEMTAVRQENGRTIWQGRNALTGAFLVTVATENDWHAILEIPAASSFEFHITGQTASVTEKYEIGACGAHRHLGSADLAQHTVVLSPDPNSVSAGTDGPPNGAVANVDVLFFFDEATFAANGRNYAAIETAIEARVESANLVLENSRVKNFRWHYVAAYQVPEYTATGKLKDDLNAVTFTDNPAGQFVNDKCALHGVDQAVVFVSGARDYAGIAWVPSGDDSLAHNAAVIWDSNYTVLAHELAHNFGCHHDRSTENAPSDDGKPSYGFRFDLNGADTGTVMSYAPNRVPYFSNPDVSYHDIKLGVAEGQPGAADNAHILAEKADMMTAHRELSSLPIIIMQPQSTTVVRGASLNLSVSAAGEGLAYQWRKNGQAIGGATNAVYSKSSTGDEDIGSYDVIVANDAGSAASRTAAVAVTTPSTQVSVSAQTNSQGQSGDGGGGAPSDWFLAALAILGVVRVLRRLTA
ncbi:MAG: M12 family metallo-peptidase [Nibricoccus sp.]